jgi:hypothetical protein
VDGLYKPLYQPGPEMVEWAGDNVPGVNALYPAVLEHFRDHYLENKEAACRRALLSTRLVNSRLLQRREFSE